MSSIKTTNSNLFYQYKLSEQVASERKKHPYVFVDNSVSMEEVPSYFRELLKSSGSNEKTETKSLEFTFGIKADEHVMDNLYMQRKPQLIKDKLITNGYEVNESLPETIRETIKAEPVIKDLKLDVINEFMLKHAPGMAREIVPEDYLYMSANTLMLNRTSDEELLKSLPIKADGTYDIEKIREALNIAVKTIKESNNNMIEQLDSYGIYKKNLNKIDAWILLFGPEIAGVLENAGLIKEGRTIGIQDIMQVPKLLMEIGLDVESEDVSAFCDQFLGSNVKSSFEIIDNLKSQNILLDELLNIDLEAEGGVEELLKVYKYATKTGFSYDSIKCYESTLSDKNTDGQTKMEKYVYAFGSYENRVDCTMNKMSTGIAYEVLLKYIIPKILSNCPYTKIVSMFIPLGVEAAETLTAGVKKGQIVNPDALNIGTAMKVAGDGFFHAIIVNGFDMGFFTKYFKNIPIPKKIQVAEQFKGLKGFKSFKGIWSKFKQWQYKNAYRSARSGVKASTLGLVEYTSNTCIKVFDKHANVKQRIESLGLNCVTGGVLVIPAAIINNCNMKSCDES